MTPQEIKQIQRAIKHYKNIRDGAIVVLDTGFGTHKGESDIVYRNRKLYAELAISALEKQVPEKPMNKYYCPSCEEQLMGKVNYCEECGQAIDWSEGA